jgi:hypothetical protein
MPRLDAVGVLTTSARLSFTLTTLQLISDLNRFGIDFVPEISAMWHRSITSAIEKARTIHKDRRFILFYDGDGAWTWQDVMRLYEVIESDDTIDAVFPCQADRVGNRPLAYGYRSKSCELPRYDYESPTQAVQSGHFALSFVRASVFDRMPHPWFWSVPGPNGRFDEDGAMDADTYFWRKLHEMNKADGRSVVQVNDVVVGHMELMIRWQAGTEVKHQGIMDFWKSQTKPDGVRTPTMTEALAAMDDGSWPGAAVPQDKHKELSNGIQQTASDSGSQDRDSSDRRACVGNC